MKASTLLNLVLTVTLSLTPMASQARQSELRGRVTTAAGAPATGAQLTLLELRRATTARSDGSYSFNNVPAGFYLLQVESTRFGSAVRQIEVTAGEAMTLDIELEIEVHREEIVVTAGGERGTSEAYQPVDVLSGDQLAVRMQPTLGETLSQEAGVTSTYFGPASSRPVIRGVGGDRIRILEEGVGAGDASNVSADHAVSIDPMSAERIEIVRGPATLLYGSNAVGGVVNVLSERIPTVRPGSPISGDLDIRYGSAASERTGGASMTGGAGPFAWAVDGNIRETDDFRSAERTIENSSLENRSGSAGGSWFGEKGFVGASFSGFSSLYGIPAAPGDESHEDVRIDLESSKLDLRGELTTPFWFFKNVRGRLSQGDYEHVELEGDEVGTRFTNESLEGRVDATHLQLGPLTGTFGVQVVKREFAAIGEEAFVPPSDTENRALFAFEELERGPFTFQFGGRYESQDISVEDELSSSRSFGGVSASLGGLYKLSENYGFSLSVARAVRLPTAEELYSNGPHLASSSFELGNPDLEEETSIGTDFAIRKLKGRVTGELSLFRNEFDGFILQMPNGEVVDALPVLLYRQEDARFTGAEGHVDVELLHREPHHVSLELSGDYVRADLDEGDQPLPRIPPLRLGAALHYRSERYWGQLEVRRTARQGRVAGNEQPTDGFTFLNLSAGYRFFVGQTVHDLLLRGTNLTDEEARSHVSLLKNIVPLPGWDIGVSYRMTF